MESWQIRGITNVSQQNQGIRPPWSPCNVFILRFRFPEGGAVPEPEDGDGEPRRGVRRLCGGGVHVVALQPAGRHPLQDLRQRQPEPRARGGADADGEQPQDLEHATKEVCVNFPVAPLLGHSLRLDDGPGGLRRLLERVQGGHLRHEINFGDYIYRDRPKSWYVVARIFKKCRQE